jgi:hypothetical protein
MLRFFSAHIRTHLIQSISIFVVTLLSSLIIILLVFLYRNTSDAIRQYSYNAIDARRFTLQNETNYFDLFSHQVSGLPTGLQAQMEADPSIDRVAAYSLVHLPVLARFALFDFPLETDIPVFSVTDTALTGSGVRIGMSRAMIDFYNSRIAGSSAMFPQIPELLMQGQSVRLIFGASRMFPPASQTAIPIEGRISQIDENFPGFGLTLPESIVRSKMTEIGHPLSPPYKIVAYMKDPADITTIKARYGAYHSGFDLYRIHGREEQIGFIGEVFLGIAVFFMIVLSLFFAFLLLSYFRERRDIFRLVAILWLTWLRAHLLTLLEPISLMIIGIIAGVLAGYASVLGLVDLISSELQSRGILYSVHTIPTSLMISIGAWLIIVFTLAILLLGYRYRQQIYRK